jgi:hypothetical protein
LWVLAGKKIGQGFGVPAVETVNVVAVLAYWMVVVVVVVAVAFVAAVWRVGTCCVSYVHWRCCLYVDDVDVVATQCCRSLVAQCGACSRTAAGVLTDAC